MLSVAHKTPVLPATAALLAAAGANVFEVDVRLIADELVVTHFAPLVRAVPRLQHDNGRLLWGLRDPRAPTLAAACATVPPEAEIMLDLKDDRGPAADRLADRLVAELPDPDRFYVSAKNWSVLHRLQAAGFRTWRTVEDRRALADLDRRGLEGAWAVTVRKTLLRDDRTLDRVLAATDGQVVVWTVNEVVEARRLLAGGVLGVTTDALDVHRLVADRS